MLRSVLVDAIAECEAARAALPEGQRVHLDDLLCRLQEAMGKAAGPPFTTTALGWRDHAVVSSALLQPT
jgi:hypothetical protein